MQMPFGKPGKVILSALLVAAVAGCAAEDEFAVQEITSVGYAEPNAVDLTKGYRRIDGATLLEAAEGVATSMRRAGLANATVVGDGSFVSASTRAPITVNCGDVLVRGEKSTSKIPANSTVAVVPVPGDSDDGFVRRNFDVKTEYSVHIGAVVGEEESFAARILGGHGYRIKTSDLTGQRTLQSASARFDYGAQASDSESVTCNSSDILERIIWN